MKYRHLPWADIRKDKWCYLLEPLRRKKFMTVLKRAMRYEFWMIRIRNALKRRDRLFIARPILLKNVFQNCLRISPYCLPKIFLRPFAKSHIFSLREVRMLLHSLFLWSIMTTSQTTYSLYIGEFDRGVILNKKPVSPRSD